MMRPLLFFLSLCLLWLCSCTKESFIRSNSAFVVTSDTALHFDTVFTSAGSVTKQLKIFNLNDQKLLISHLELMGGNASSFKINVSGMPGTQFSAIEMAGGDSLYVFVTVNINPNGQAMPFVVEDSIRIDYNGNTQYVKLDAYGQNAHFLRGVVIDENETWPADLPYVILDTFSVSKGAALTIEKGARIYCHANTPFTVSGSLRVMGTDDSSGAVMFRNDRLDAPYAQQPGTWQGITFLEESHNNMLRYAHVLNAGHGIAVGNLSELTLQNCIISNCAGEGIAAANSTVTATNCLISNCSYNLYVSAGGQYSFTHCTFASYTTQYLYHQFPVLTLLTGGDDGSSHPLTANFTNCIVWGEDGLVADETGILNESATSLNVSFDNCLYKSPSVNRLASYRDCLANADPLFQTTDRENNVFDFHLLQGSPCIDAGTKAGIAADIEGRTRTDKPDIGAYEYKE